tara:strand:+ start:1462 stop:1752 length:291 start_codon:yes stop_codon:yes gene_type:complete
MTQVFEFDGSTFSSTYELQGFEQNLCCDDDPHLAAAVGTGWVSHVHEQGKEAAAARGEAPLQEVPRSATYYLPPTTYLPLTAYYLLLTAHGSRLTD